MNRFDTFRGTVADPVHAAGPAQGVAPGECLRNPGQSRYRQAGAHRVAATQQRPEVDAVQRPQRRGDQVAPTPVRPGAPPGPQLAAGADPDGRIFPAATGSAAHDTGPRSPFTSPRIMLNVLRRCTRTIVGAGSLLPVSLPRGVIAGRAG